MTTVVISPELLKNTSLEREILVAGETNPSRLIVIEAKLIGSVEIGVGEDPDRTSVKEPDTVQVVRYGGVTKWRSVKLLDLRDFNRPDGMASQ